MSSRNETKKAMKNDAVALQVIYDEMERCIKKWGNYEDFDSDIPLDTKALDEDEKMFEVASNYLDENFTEDFLKTTNVKPGPLLQKVMDRMQAQAEAIKNAKIVSFTDNDNEYNEYLNERYPSPDARRLLFGEYIPYITNAKDEIDYKKRMDDFDLKLQQGKARDSMEMAPYNKRLQDLIAQRRGR